MQEVCYRVRRKFWSAALSVTLFATCSAADEDAVAYRKLVMRQLSAEAEALGMLAARQIPLDTLAFEARAIAFSAKAAAKSFDAKVPGGMAKPEIWLKWEDFSKRMQAFVQKTEEMAIVAETGNVARVTELMVDALTCKQCHDVYKSKGKKK